MAILRNLKGTKFGRLFVMEMISASEYLCFCECGQKKVVKSANLRNGSTLSCGCLHRERVSAARRGVPFGVTYKQLIRSASKRGYEVQVTFGEFLEFTKLLSCHYCAAPIPWRPHCSEAYFLDRKDNNIGYLRDNLVVCCPRCNHAKGDRFTYDEWVCMTSALRAYKEQR